MDNMYDINILACVIRNRCPEEYVNRLTSKSLAILLYFIQRDFCIIKKQLCFSTKFNVWDTGIHNDDIRQYFGMTSLPIQIVKDSFLYSRINTKYSENELSLLDKINNFKFHEKIDECIVVDNVCKYARKTSSEMINLAKQDALYKQKYKERKSSENNNIYITEEDMLEYYANFIILHDEIELPYT